MGVARGGCGTKLNQRGVTAECTALTVLPPMITAERLLSLGIGGQTEDTAGLVILDEA